MLGYVSVEVSRGRLRGCVERVRREGVLSGCVAWVCWESVSRRDMSMLTNVGRVYTKTIMKNTSWAIERA